MMPNLMKKPVSRMFLKLRLSVHRTVTDLQADSRVRELDDDDVEDLGGSHGRLRPPFSRNFCRTEQIRFLKEILKTLTQKATYYTLSVTSWTKRRPQPLKGGGDGGYGEGVPHDSEEQFENLNNLPIPIILCISKEMIR